jgi:hypothetical protein
MAGGIGKIDQGKELQARSIISLTVVKYQYIAESLQLVLSSYFQD